MVERSTGAILTQLMTQAALIPTIASGPILPAWVVLPIAVLTMLIIAAHTIAMGSINMPASRRRIRSLNAWVMLFTTALLAYAFGIATTDEPQVFALAWTFATISLAFVLLFACLDMLNNARIYASDRKRIRQRLVDARERLAAQATHSGDTAAGDPPSDS